MSIIIFPRSAYNHKFNLCNNYNPFFRKVARETQRTVDVVVISQTAANKIFFFHTRLTTGPSPAPK